MLDQSNGAKGHSTWGQAVAEPAIYIELQLIAGRRLVLPSPPAPSSLGHTSQTQSINALCCTSLSISPATTLSHSIPLSLPSPFDFCRYHWVCFVLSTQNKCKIKVLEPSVEWRWHKTKGKFAPSEKPPTLSPNVFFIVFLCIFILFIFSFSCGAQKGFRQRLRPE